VFKMIKARSCGLEGEKRTKKDGGDYAYQRSIPKALPPEQKIKGEITLGGKVSKRHFAAGRRAVFGEVLSSRQGKKWACLEE